MIAEVQSSKRPKRGRKRALVLLAVTIQFAGRTDGRFGGWQWLVPLVALAVLTAVSLWLLPRFSRFFFRQTDITPAEKGLYVFVVILLLAMATEWIGTEAILGAFLAGVCLNPVLAAQEELRSHIEFAGRLLFIPFFFAATGMRLELEIFTWHPSVWLMGTLLVGLVLFGKTAASWWIGAWYGYSSPGPRPVGGADHSAGGRHPGRHAHGAPGAIV